MTSKDYKTLLQRAYRALDKAEQQITRLKSQLKIPIAVVGIGCRFPGGVNSPEDFWELLIKGDDPTSEIPVERWDVDAYYSNDITEPGKMNTRRGSFLDNIDKFDADFFNISPKEAQYLDPQHRLLLEVSWQAFENAGFRREDVAGSRTGVYVGMLNHDYTWLNYASMAQIHAFAGSGSAASAAAGRLSHWFDLRGPNLALDTACSSSLVTIILACQSLRRNECDMALAGGVNVVLHPGLHASLSKAGMLSPTGYCHTFDAEADGYVRGEGCGMVVLKRMDDALATGDRILGVIKGGAFNHDGRALSLTAPNGSAQVSVIRDALKDANLEATEIGYIEVHGTGTPLGDPVEIHALDEVFNSRNRPKESLILGAVKSNIGHLEAAAGVASLIKVLLILQHNIIPANLNFKRLNPYITLPDTFKIATTHQKWMRDEQITRFAGISSFGFSGTNAHIILGDAPISKTTESRHTNHILPISGANAQVVEQQCHKLADWLQRQARETPNRVVALADVAYTLQQKRDAQPYRTVAIGHNFDTIVPEVRAAIDDVKQVENKVPLAFMFGGDNTSQLMAARELYVLYPAFKAAIDDCAARSADYIAYDIRQLFYPLKDLSLEKRTIAQEKLAQHTYKPMLSFVIAFALSKLWQTMNVHPVAMIGHGFGEYVAAVYADVISLDNILAFMAKYSDLMALCPATVTTMISAPEHIVQQDLPDNVWIAAINGNMVVTVVASETAMTDFESVLHQQGIAYKRLEAAYSLPSPTMASITDALVQHLKDMPLNPPKIPFISSRTGNWITDKQACDPRYWAEQVIHPVRFWDGLQKLCERALLLIDVGIDYDLRRSVIHIVSKYSDAHQVLLSSTDSAEQGHDTAVWLKSLGVLWQRGHAVDWSPLWQEEERQVESLPPYSFLQTHHWHDTHAKALRQLHLNEDILADVDLGRSHFYVSTWSQSPPLASRATSRQEEHWLIFTLDNPQIIAIQNYFTVHLRRTGAQITTIIPDNDFAVFDDGSRYKLPRENSESYLKLLKTLLAQNTFPTHVLFLWSLNVHPSDQDEATFEAIQAWTTYPALALLQAIITTAPLTSQKLQCVALCSGLVSVHHQDRIQPALAPFQALAQVVEQEYDLIRWYMIDSDIYTLTQLRTLKDEIDHLDTHNERVAIYRGNRRWQHHLKPFVIDDSREQRPLPLKEDGLYVIFGGHGNIGNAMTEVIARQVAANIILVGRSVFPERADWTDWLLQHPDDSKSQKIAHYQALEGLCGARIFAYQADMSKCEEVKMLFEQLRDRFGKLNGVLHVAGIIGNESLQPIDSLHQAHFQTHFAAKVRGTLNIAHALKQHSPDFCVLFSSISSVIGGYGMAAYAGANAFQDAFVHTGAYSGTWQSLNWDIWQSDLQKWSQSRLQAIALDKKAGQAYFEDALRWLSVPQLIITQDNLHARLRLKRQREKPPERQNNVGLAREFIAPQTSLEQSIANIWQSVLGIDAVGVEDDFFNLGGDSISGIRMVTQLRQSFDVDIAVEDLLEAKTIRHIANYIETNRIHGWE